MAKSIMIQGTMSNAGKSIFAAALCRILKQDGYRVAPFKSQNMALNSFITAEGLEMGRAQVMQAEAAGVTPEVAMNPILLKPTTDVGSQVIVNGKVIGNMRAAEYFKYKKNLIPVIREAYEKLDNEYDVIVIEGAGSPAELNLKQDDIVNMGLAKMVNAPVLLVGDIDRGGVFAQLIGTVKLLEEDERKLIKGLVVNKFRGDIKLFDDGVKILEEKSGKKVVGVVPYMNVDIEDEDSLSSKLENDKRGMIDIAVIRLPKISNYTDFDVFNQYSGVSVRYVSDASKLEEPDMIIIPGTKNTISDCIWLREKGLEAEIKKCVSKDIPVFGICGGYQILGMTIEDSEHLENETAQKVRGMELLPIRTVFEKEKRQTRVKGKFKSVGGIFSELEGMDIEGYEIHMGRTVSDREAMIFLFDSVSGNVLRNNSGNVLRNDSGNVLRNDSGNVLRNDSENILRDVSGKTLRGVSENATGNVLEIASENASSDVLHNAPAVSSCYSLDGCNVSNIYGSYIHGIFDSDKVSEIIVRKLYEKKGYEFGGAVVSREKYKEMQYEKLADIVRGSINMEYLYSIM